MNGKTSLSLKEFHARKTRCGVVLQHQIGTSELFPRDPDLTMTLTTFGLSGGLPLSAVYY